MAGRSQLLRPYRGLATGRDSDSIGGYISTFCKKFRVNTDCINRNSDNVAFNDAMQAHLDKLDPAERATFLNPHQILSAGTILYKIRGYDREYCDGVDVRPSPVGGLQSPRPR